MSTEEIWKNVVEELGIQLPASRVGMPEGMGVDWEFPVLAQPEQIASWLKDAVEVAPDPVFGAGMLLRYVPGGTRIWNAHIYQWKALWDEEKKESLMFSIGEQETYIQMMAGGENVLTPEGAMQLLETLEHWKTVARVLGIEVQPLEGMEEIVEGIKGSEVDAMDIYGEDYVYGAKWQNPEAEWLWSPQHQQAEMDIFGYNDEF
jgi:hypothetical protein